MSSLLLGIFLSIRTCWFHNMVPLPSWLVSTDFGTWAYQSSLSNFNPIITIIIIIIIIIIMLLLLLKKLLPKNRFRPRHL